MSSDIPVPGPRKAIPKPETTLTVGAFYAEHRALIDSRKADLARVGVGVTSAPADVPGLAPLPHQAKALAMPTTHEAPLLDAVSAPVVPETPPKTYDAPKLPKLLGVNASLVE